MTVRRLLSECDSAELTDWLAVRRMDPWGEERADLRAGVVAAAAVNVWAKTPASPADFMPDYSGRRKKGQTQEQMMAAAMMMCGA